MGNLLRVYEYQCRRCGQLFDDQDGRDSAVMYDAILVIGIPDTQEIAAFRAANPDFYLEDVSGTHVHECDDGGLGIGDFAGCSAAKEETAG